MPWMSNSSLRVLVSEASSRISNFVSWSTTEIISRCIFPNEITEFIVFARHIRTNIYPFRLEQLDEIIFINEFNKDIDEGVQNRLSCSNQENVFIKDSLKGKAELKDGYCLYPKPRNRRDTPMRQRGAMYRTIVAFSESGFFWLFLHNTRSTVVSNRRNVNN